MSILFLEEPSLIAPSRYLWILRNEKGNIETILPLKPLQYDSHLSEFLQFETDCISQCLPIQQRFLGILCGMFHCMHFHIRVCIFLHNEAARFLSVPFQLFYYEKFKTYTNIERIVL